MDGDRSVTPSVERSRLLSFAEARTALAGAQKSSKGSPAYSRFVNRKLGRLLAAAAYRLGMTPNAVTAVSAAFTFCGIALLALVRPSWLLGFAIAACLVVGYALDAADGQLARLLRVGSKSGEWLDHMVDSTKASSLHLAVLISFYRFTDLPRQALLVPILFAIVAAVMFFGMTLNDQLRRQHLAQGGQPIGPTRTSSVRSLLVLPTDYGLHCCIFIVFGAPTLFFWVYAVVFLGNIGFMLLASVKWFRDMRALDLAELQPE